MKTFARFSAVAVSIAHSAGALSAQQPASAAAVSAQEPTVAATKVRHEVGTQVRVTNRNLLDVRIYLDNGGTLTPLGFVLAQQTALFPIPERALTFTNRLRIVAIPIGSTSAKAKEKFILPRP